MLWLRLSAGPVKSNGSLKLKLGLRLCNLQGKLPWNWLVPAPVIISNLGQHLHFCVETQQNKPFLSLVVLILEICTRTGIAKSHWICGSGYDCCENTAGMEFVALGNLREVFGKCATIWFLDRPLLISACVDVKYVNAKSCVLDSLANHAWKTNYMTF